MELTSDPVNPLPPELFEDQEVMRIVPSDRRCAFRRLLQQVAVRHLQRVERSSKFGSNNDQYEAISKLARKVDEFCSYLGQTSVELRQSASMATAELNGHRFEIEFELHEQESNALAVSHFATTEPPDPNRAFLDFDLLQSQLGLLSDGLKFHAEVEVQKVRKGERARNNLHAYIADMSLFWQGVLRRPFTRDEQGSEPVSDAAIMSVATYKVLSPETPATKVLEAMKRHITEQAKLTGENRGCD